MFFKSKPSSAQLRHLVADLQSAEKNLKSDPNVDGKELRELRHALDNLRLTAWTVSELQNARDAKKDPRAISSFMTAERLRRIRRMVDDLCADIEHEAAACSEDSINDLQESLRVLRKRLLASEQTSSR